MFIVSATTPCPGNAASPWISTATAASGSSVGAPGLRVSSCEARVIPTTTGLTNSRWLGFGERVTRTSRPPISLVSSHPMWYFTSPDGSSVFCAWSAAGASCALWKPASIIA